MKLENASHVLRDAQRIVVKVGSSLVTNEGRGLDEEAIGEWCRQLSMLVRSGREVIMVSSGAIAEGMKRLGWRTRPHSVHELQAVWHRCMKPSCVNTAWAVRRYC
jgi:glutamate 5-kinase